MKRLPYKETHRIIIDPGEFYVSNKPEIISTLLGSCVSACIYDPVNHIYGMNHFLLAHRNSAHNETLLESDEGRYGMYAMELLINALMKKGASRLNLKAKCFGGGNILRMREDDINHQTVGDLNVEFIKAYLKSENIPFLGGSLGGSAGRNIHFIGSDYSVYAKEIGSETTKKLEVEERSYLVKSITQHKRMAAKAPTSDELEFF